MNHLLTLAPSKTTTTWLRDLIFVGVLLVFCSCSKKSNQIEASLIVDINELTYTIANKYDQFFYFIGVCTLTIVHLTIDDILNSVDQQFEHYYFNEPLLGIGISTAAISACRTILLNAYSSQEMRAS